jgi:hypothetical protein
MVQAIFLGKPPVHQEMDSFQSNAISWFAVKYLFRVLGVFSWMLKNLLKKTKNRLALFSNSLLKGPRGLSIES